MPTRTRVKVSPEMGESGSQEQECRQNKAQLINSLQVVNKKLAIMIMVIMTMVPMKMLLLLKLLTIDILPHTQICQV